MLHTSEYNLYSYFIELYIYAWRTTFSNDVLLHLRNSKQHCGYDYSNFPVVIFKTDIQLLNNGRQPLRGGVGKMLMETSVLPLGNKGYCDRKCKICNIVLSIKINILYMQLLVECCYKKIKS